MCGFQLAGRRWLQRGCLAGRFIEGGHPIHSVVSLLQGLPRHTPEHILGTNMVMALLVPVGQWRVTALKWCTKSGNGHGLVLQSCRCSTLAAAFSGLNWLIKLSWTAILCYRRAFSVMCFRRKCSAAWQGARGERLTLAIMLPGRQDADDWLNFMLSQKNLWPTFTTRGTLTEEVSEQVFRKERRRLQAKHLWMEVLRWRVLADRMYTKALQRRTRCSAF